MSRGGFPWRWGDFAPELRSWPAVAAIAAALLLLLAAPEAAGLLDRRGLPGGAIVLAIVVLAAAAILCGWWTMMPSGARRREVMRWARDRDAPFRSGFRVPRRLRAVTSLHALRAEGGVANLVVVRIAEGEVLVFDRWRAPAPGYEEAEWRTAAALQADLDLPRIVIQPRRDPFRLSAGESGLPVIGTESEAFDRRFRILSVDRAAAVAIVDQRMMAWLLDGPSHLAFETAGSWLVCSEPTGPVAQRDGLIAAVMGLRDQLPRVSASLFPVRDPGFGPPAP